MWIKVDQDNTLWQADYFESILAFSNYLEAEIFIISWTINVIVETLLTFYALNIYEDMEVQLRAFQTSALDGDVLSVSRSGLFMT